MVGSHIDTVRDAGRYDGNLGALAALAVVEQLAESGERLDHRDRRSSPSATRRACAFRQP